MSLLLFFSRNLGLPVSSEITRAGLSIPTFGLNVNFLRTSIKRQMCKKKKTALQVIMIIVTNNSDNFLIPNGMCSLLTIAYINGSAERKKKHALCCKCQLAFHLVTLKLLKDPYCADSAASPGPANINKYRTAFILHNTLSSAFFSLSLYSSMLPSRGG